MSNTNHKQACIGVTALTMITITAMVNLRNLPVIATAGSACITYYLLAAITFLIPSSYVCGRLAAHTPQEGGVYLWVSRALGKQAGFFTMWFEWLNNVIAFPATLSFITTTLLSIVLPHSAHSRHTLPLLCIALLWGLTFFNFLHIKRTKLLNMVGGTVGLLFPIFCIIALAGYWCYLGNPSALHWSLSDMMPSESLAGWAPFITALGGYSGMQICAFHAIHVNNPATTYPKAMFISVLLILLMTIGGTLAIACIIPPGQLNLISGLIDSIEKYFSAFAIGHLTAIFLACIVIGVTSDLNAWLIGPAQGLATSARAGHLPKRLGSQNRFGSPTQILILQAVIASAFTLLFEYIDNVNTAFWILIVQTSQFTLLTHILVFISALVTHYREGRHTPFKLCQSKRFPLIWLICGMPILTCGFAYCVSFVPPDMLHIQNKFLFEGSLLLANLVYITIPFVIGKRITATKLKDLYENQQPQTT